MAHTFTNVLIHAVFSTSGRAPLLTETVRSDMHAYLGGILKELNVVPVVIGGTADHVHLLMELPGNVAVADCMRVVKTNSSRWAKKRWPSFAWQGGYGAFSVSQSRRAVVVRYIQDQEEHHRRISFQDEFLTLLRNHGVEFDERYVWQ